MGSLSNSRKFIGHFNLSSTLIFRRLMTAPTRTVGPGDRQNLNGDLHAEGYTKKAPANAVFFMMTPPLIALPRKLETLGMASG